MELILSNQQFFFVIFFNIENFDLIVKLIKQYGDFIRVWFGPELNVVVRDPKDVEVSKCIFQLDYKQRNDFFYFNLYTSIVKWS